MNDLLFITIWNALEDWSLKTKQLYSLGIDTARYDKNLYDVIIKLLEHHFNKAQIDFIVWSIFDETRVLPLINDSTIIIDTAELCWEYVNKIETIKN